MDPILLTFKGILKCLSYNFGISYFDTDPESDSYVHGIIIFPE